jgi:glycine/serine hydroxymethyltransferase
MALLSAILPTQISATSIFFESMPYTVRKSDGLIDYDQLEANAKVGACIDD